MLGLERFRQRAFGRFWRQKIGKGQVRRLRQKDYAYILSNTNMFKTMGVHDMAKRFYELQVAGCTRKLSILNISDKLAIAGFILLGDVELVTNCAAELAKRMPKDADIIMTAETKGIPLAAELARQMGMKWYVTARKSVKAYMENPLWVEDESITTKGKQMLCLMDADIERIKGKKVVILDDVISTGGSLRALEALAEKAGAEVICKAAVLAEGDAAERKDIIFLEKLPLFDAE